jgi:hypothetical protein
MGLVSRPSPSRRIAESQIEVPRFLFGFEGCISTLKAMTIIAEVPEDKRSPTQLRRVQRFQEFGCSTCHKVSPGKMGLTETAAKLAGLHLGCVEVEKLVAGGPAPNR